MIFLNSSVLYCLPLLLVPVIIHLLNLYKPKVVYFSKVAFLEKIAETTSSRLRLKQWLILLARLLFVLFLILAFSQPYIRNENTVNKGGDVMIYIDNSSSMFVQENGYMPFSKAVDIADKLIEGLNASQRVFLLTNSFSGVDKLPLTKKQALERLLGVEETGVSRKTTEILSRWKLLFEEGESEYYFISDLQQFDFLPKEEMEGVKLVPVQQSEYPNVLVDSVWFDSPAMVSGKNVTLHLLLKAYNVKEELTTGVQLKISEEVIFSQQVLWASGETRKELVVNFDLGNAGLYQGLVSLDDVPANFDNSFYFAFEVLDRIGVAVLSDKDKNPLVEVYEYEPLFDVKSFKDGAVQAEALENASLLIVEGTEIIKNNKQVVEQKLKEGATVLMLPELGADYTVFSEYVNFTLGDTAKNELFINTKHAYWNGILLNEKERLVNAWFVSPLRFTESMDFLFHSEEGKGVVGVKDKYNGQLAVLPFALDAKCTNFHQHAFFVPFMYELAFRAGNGTKKLYYRDTERTVQLPLLGQERVVELQHDDKVYLFEKMNQWYRTDVRLEVGVYNRVENEKKPYLAVNGERKESNPEFADLEELKSHYGNTVLDFSEDYRMVQYFKNMDLGFPLWKYCVVLCLLFLIVEISLIKWLR